LGKADMNTLQKTFMLLFLAMTLVLIYLLKPILMPFLVGFLLAYLGDPLVDRLEAVGLNRTLGVFVVFLVFTILLVGGGLVLVPVVIREISSLVQQVPEFIIWLQQNVSPWLIANVGVDPFDLQLDELKKSLAANWQKAGGFAGTLVKEVTRSGLVMVTWMMNFLLIPVVSFYLLRDWDHLMGRLRELLPREFELAIVGIARECDEVLSAFLRGQLLIMLLLGCIYAVGLLTIGLELAVMIGMLAGLASIVPYLGFIVGITAATIAAMFQFQEPIYLLYVAIIFGIGQALEGMVLTPLLVGDRIGLHPVAVIFSVLAGAQLFGFVGVLMALPVAAVLMVFLRHLHASYKSSEYYGSE